MGWSLFKRLEVILVVVCLCVTFGVYARGMQVINNTAATEMRRVTEDSIQTLQVRMNTYLQSLNAAAGMMHTSENLEYDDFEVFVDSLNLQENLPGLSGIGFIEAVPSAQMPAYVADLRTNGLTDFSVHPKTDSDVKYIIKYIAPIATNAEALGLDITFEKGRREAAERARDMRSPQLTQRIVLVQDETKQPGFLLLNPVFYQKGPREGEFRGWVYSPFVGKKAMQNLTLNQSKMYDFQVYEGIGTDPEMLIHGSDLSDEVAGQYSTQYTTSFFGRPWTIHYQSTKYFDDFFPGRAPLLLFLAGILLTGMMAVALREIRLRGNSMEEIAALRAKQISAREEENKSIMENTVVAVLILDENRKILSANCAAVECFGCKDFNEMGGVPLGQFVTEVSDIPSNSGYNAVGKTMGGGKLYLDLQQNGWVTLNGVRRTTAIVRDVTVEMGAVKELAITKQRYDMALDGSEIGVFEVNLRTGSSVVSQTWRKIMQVDEDEEDTQGIFMNRIHPDDLPDLFEADRKCIMGETGRSVTEYRMGFGDGWRWMLSDAVVIERDDTGTAVRMVGTQTDITELRHSRNALEASEVRFRTVVEAAPVGMAILDDQGRFVAVNGAMCALTGYTEPEMLDELTMMRIVPSDDMRRMRKALLAATEMDVQEVYREEHRIMPKNGGERWGLFNITWTYDKNANAHVYIAQVVDITDKKKLDQIKSEFVSTVSHELRTPLTSIKGALGLIDVSAREKLPETTMRLIEIARTNADRLTNIVNDILDLEKISSGEVDFYLGPVDIGETVEAAVHEMMPFAQTHDNTLVCELPDTPVFATADRSRTVQVLANLISNACKYSSEHTEVCIKLEQLDDVAIIYVQNRGPGVPESFRNRIFQAFSQADGSDTRAKGGTGLGLNITRQIVKRQGGEIGFESMPGGLTVFWFTCPIAKAVEMPERPELFGPETWTGRRLQILHVEDDEDFAEVIRTGLDPLADVRNVTRVAKARKMLTEGPLDVIILDWKLPDGDATVLLEEIGRTQAHARIISLSSDAAHKKDHRVNVNLVKSQTEIAHLIACVSDLTRKAS